MGPEWIAVVALAAVVVAGPLLVWAALVLPGR